MAHPEEPYIPPDSERDIENYTFCDLINEAQQNKATLRVVYKQGKFWQRRSRRQSLSIERQKDMTLTELLSAVKMSLKQQRKLAVILSHAALHGYKGPWLSDQWNKDHITFFRTDRSGAVDIDRPFLKVNFDDYTTEVNVADDPYCISSSSALSSLGILLLEIYRNKPIEDDWRSEDLTNNEPNEYTNVSTAWRLLKEAKNDIYEGYRDAIFACLKGDGFEDSPEAMRDRVYQDIVYPLEEELRHGWHLAPEDEEFGGDNLSDTGKKSSDNATRKQQA